MAQGSIGVSGTDVGPVVLNLDQLGGCKWNLWLNCSLQFRFTGCFCLPPQIMLYGTSFLPVVMLMNIIKYHGRACQNALAIQLWYVGILAIIRGEGALLASLWVQSYGRSLLRRINEDPLLHLGLGRYCDYGDSLLDALNSPAPQLRWQFT